MTKKPKIEKIAKNGNSNKIVIFLCLNHWELKSFWLGGVDNQVSQF